MRRRKVGGSSPDAWDGGPGVEVLADEEERAGSGDATGTMTLGCRLEMGRRGVLSASSACSA